MSSEESRNEEILEERIEAEESVEQEDTRTELEKAVDDLAEAQAEVLKYKNEYLRVHADFDNSKKRLEKEKATAVAYSNESFAKDMLGVLDSFDNALHSISQIEEGEDAMEKFREGLELTYDQMIKALKRNGVEEILTEGEFDPNLHQAIMQVESEEHESGYIVQTMQKGYTMKDRVIRPSMVSTCK
jgi:molecular chaperone GrpE